MDGVGDLLLVDDEESLIRAFQKFARRYQFNLHVAKTAVEALELLNSNSVDVALLDLNLPEMSGLQILDYIKKNSLPTEAIIITGRASIETAISSLKMGAYDYLIKPFDDIDRVAAIIQKAQEKVQLVRRIRALESQEIQRGDMFGALVGKSFKMQQIYSLIDSVAPSDSTVLIVGESGTGKELVAKLVHEKSFRHEKRFVVVNCGAIPETLLESELFGHVRGSYTGAVSDKKGLFEEADGGTIFLDEIGEIPLAMQVKLLRVLQDGEVRRVGGNDTIHVNVRVLSATNRDLYDMVRHKTFREDLFYRLNVITLHMPSLRERGQDVPLLAYYFLKKYSLKLGKKVEQISLDALQSLQEYQWPGNVRELENVMERALVLTEGAVVTSRELPPKILGEVFYQQEEKDETIELSSLTYQQAKDKAIGLFNRSYLGQLLRVTDGNLSLASSRAGMDRSNFKKIIKKNHMNAGEFKKKRGQKYG